MMPDEPISDEQFADDRMPDEPLYDEWIANRRAFEPSVELVDRVMAEVEQRDAQRIVSLRLVDRMNESTAVRWAACLAASFVGCLPFLYVAYVAELLVV